MTKGTMNKRIEELFGKALDQAVPETWTTLNPAQLSKLKDKFAELIVRECANEIRKQGDGESLDDWDRGYEAGLISAINALHKHFGVE